MCAVSDDITRQWLYVYVNKDQIKLNKTKENSRPRKITIPTYKFLTLRATHVASVKGAFH